MKKSKQLLTLFFNMLYISAFTFGGGFVIASIAKKRFVDKLHLVEENEMLDYIAIAQSCPGAIAVNTSILIGWNIAGLPGMIVSVLGTAIPPVVILCIVSFFYNAFADNLYVALFLKGMQAGVSAVIFDVVYTLGKNVLKEKSMPCTVVMAVAFIAVVFFDVNVIAIITVSFLIGIIAVLFERKKAKKL